MSLSSTIRIPLAWPNIDVFTFGELSLFGYDSQNSCIVVVSLIEVNNSNDLSIIRLHLSSSRISSIRRLILNEDETILALIADQIVYLVYLPQSKNSPSKGSRLCPINVVPPLVSNSRTINNSLIDFIWLSPLHFVVVYCYPSSSECHLYIVNRSKQNSIQLVRTFSVGSFSKSNVTPNKRVSLRQPSDIVKLDLAKRKDEDLTLILLFAMKADGDIFIMEIEQQHLLNNEEILSCEFVGPLRLFPSRFDNYGADHSHSKLLCLSCSSNPVVIFTRNKCEINQCIYLNPSFDSNCLFTIDSITLPTNENTEVIKLMISDRLNSNRYYVSDSLSNVYSIEISWIDQIKQISSTTIQHLIKTNHLNNSIQQIGLIQTNNKGQWLAIITKTLNNQQKELILIRPESPSLSSISSRSFKPDNLTKLEKSGKSNSSSEFLNRIRSLLKRDESYPRVTLSSSSSTTISQSDFENNLLKFLKLFSEEYIEKQERVRQELENKERYLFDFQQTQFIAYQELNEKFQQIKETLEILFKQYQQEYSRRKHLSSSVDDLLSVIEQHTPVVSDAEIIMNQQLERYQIQINYLAEKIHLIKQFISTHSFNENQQQIDQFKMENIQTFVQYHRSQIDQMKKQLQTIDNKK